MHEIPLVLATKNEGKIREFQALLADFEMDLRSLNDFGPIPPIEEDGNTFDENAYKKAYFTAKYLGFPALADDSGLVVDALGGRPGVFSARFAGEGASDEENYLKLLNEMEGVENRTARFVCIISIAVPLGPALTYEGRCEGEITRTPMGRHGFGYDPVFFYTPLEKTFAQMPPEEKNRVSHRAKAMQELRQEFEAVMTWLAQRWSEMGL
jgi:XTP/dITP diphosphohydrolase